MDLYKVNMSTEEINRRKRDSSHWNAVAKALYSSDDLEEIKRMLVTEIHGLNRPYIVRRIYAHYNSARRKTELEHIASFTREIRSLKLKDR